MAAKIVFRRVRGRIIPIKKRGGDLPDELQNVIEVKKARRYFKKQGETPDILGGTFLNYTRRNAKRAGKEIRKRIALMKRLNKK